MATVQKAISESGSLTTKTLVTTISAPGIKQDAVISVTPSIDASKVSYVIDEVAGTVTVTLTTVEYTRSASNYRVLDLVNVTSHFDGQGRAYFTCHYSDGLYSYSYSHGPYEAGDTVPSCSSTYTRNYATYYFEYVVTVIYKTFPEFTVKASNQKRKSIDGWVRVIGQLRQIQKMWVCVNGQLKEV